VVWGDYCRCCCFSVLELAVAASKTDPPDVLDRQKCLDALAEQRRSKWFQVCCLSLTFQSPTSHKYCWLVWTEKNFSCQWLWLKIITIAVRMFIVENLIENLILYIKWFVGWVTMFFTQILIDVWGWIVTVLNHRFIRCWLCLEQIHQVRLGCCQFVVFVSLTVLVKRNTEF